MPRPLLVSAPPPERVSPRVRDTPSSVEMVLLVLLVSVTARLEENEPITDSVPPDRVRPAELFPRFWFAPISSVPAATVVPPL